MNVFVKALRPFPCREGGGVVDCVTQLSRRRSHCDCRGREVTTTTLTDRREPISPLTDREIRSLRDDFMALEVRAVMLAAGIWRSARVVSVSAEQDTAHRLSVMTGVEMVTERISHLTEQAGGKAPDGEVAEAVLVAARRAGLDVWDHGTQGSDVPAELVRVHREALGAAVSSAAAEAITVGYRAAAVVRQAKTRAGLPASDAAPSLTVAAAREHVGRYLDVAGKLDQRVIRRRPPGRDASILDEVNRSGTYTLDDVELLFGASVAWALEAKCVGRFYFRSLHLRDRRSLTSAEDIAADCVEHVLYSTNGGAIRPTISIYAPGVRLINEQLIRYAGYRQPNGSVIGDPRNEALTNLAIRLGWKGGTQTPFDVLPVMVKTPDGRIVRHDLPDDAVLEVPLSHSEHPWFGELGLKWHALPAISDMRLDTWGVSHSGVAFSGWYLNTEIGARNLSDEDRYNLLPVVADRLGLDVTTDRSLWQDKAQLVLNEAVLGSFDGAGVRMEDHHQGSDRFINFLDQMERRGIKVPTDWIWIVPPMSPATLGVFHRLYSNFEVSERFVHQAPVQELQREMDHVEAVRDNGGLGWSIT